MQVIGLHSVLKSGSPFLLIRGGDAPFLRKLQPVLYEELQHFIGNFPFQVFHSGRFVSNNLTLPHKPQEEAQGMYLKSFVFIEKVLHDIHLIYTGTPRSHCIQGVPGGMDKTSGECFLG